MNASLYRDAQRLLLPSVTSHVPARCATVQERGPKGHESLIVESLLSLCGNVFNNLQSYMGLVDDYRQQFGWRSWNAIFAELPLVAGQTVLDLGCGIGDLARELAGRGAYVIGIDGNREFIDEALARRLANCEFRCGDLRDLADITHRVGSNKVGGIWCSFAAVYFTDSPAVLSRWGRVLDPGGWIARLRRLTICLGMSRSASAPNFCCGVTRTMRWRRGDMTSEWEASWSHT